MKRYNYGSSKYVGVINNCTIYILVRSPSKRIKLLSRGPLQPCEFVVAEKYEAVIFFSPKMAAIVSTCGRAYRVGRAVVLGRRLLSGAVAVEENRADDLSRLEALRQRLKEEKNSGLDVHDFTFSGEVHYGTAVPRRNRDKDGKVSK